MNTSLDNTEREDCFEYLDKLRDSALINMFGAGSYLMDEFDISKKDARSILSEWMQTYHTRNGKDD